MIDAPMVRLIPKIELEAVLIREDCEQLLQAQGTISQARAAGIEV